MRVAIIVKEFPPDSVGGLQTQTKRMASAVAESDNETDVTVFTKRYRDHDDSELPHDVVRVPQLSVSPFISDLTFLTLCFFALIWHSREIDCMQCMTIYPIGFLGLMVNRVTGVPYFAWIRGNDFYQMRHTWWKRWMIRQVLSDTRVLVQSEEIEVDVREFIPELEPDIGVLGNGVTVPDEQASLDSNIVLFVGRLAPKKGVKYLIEAMSCVESDAELWIVGDGQKRSELEQQASEVDIEATFYGEVGPGDVDDFYRKATVLVLPSLEGEGMPNAVLEAMSHGVPVVTTRSGGLPEMVVDGESGLLVPMYDSEELADSISTVLNSNEKRKNMGNEAREYVASEHSWPTLSCKIKMEYNAAKNYED